MAFTRVYWKGLELSMNATRRYIQRHQLRLEENLTEDQYNCVVAVLNAIVECLALLPKNEPVA